MDFGTQVLSHPLVVETIETFFTPVCIHNNSKAAGDVAVLEKYREPTWNNPVTRVLAADGHDLAPRNGDGWTVASVLHQATVALGNAKHEVPDWLALVEWEATSRQRRVETAVFGMT